MFKYFLFCYSPCVGQGPLLIGFKLVFGILSQPLLCYYLTIQKGFCICVLILCQMNSVMYLAWFPFISFCDLEIYPFCDVCNWCRSVIYLMGVEGRRPLAFVEYVTLCIAICLRVCE